MAVRHVIGLILAVVMAGVVFGAAGWGVWEVSLVLSGGHSLTTAHGVEAIAVLAGAGLLLGILIVAPAVSPLAVGLPGLVLLAWSALLVVSLARADRLIPMHSPAVATGFRTLLNSGVLALLGMIMVIPLFMPSRWRRRYDDDDGFGRSTPTSLLR
jgi:hypothetical protein